MSNRLEVRITPQGIVVSELLKRFGIGLRDPILDLVREQFLEEKLRGCALGYQTAAKMLREKDLNKAAELIEALFTTEEDTMRGEMAVMGREGDVKVIWDSENADEVTAAREQFDSLTKKGYWAYSVDKKGEKGERIKKFDPNAERIILATQLQGG